MESENNPVDHLIVNKLDNVNYLNDPSVENRDTNELRNNSEIIDDNKPTDDNNNDIKSREMQDTLTDKSRGEVPVNDIHSDASVKEILTNTYVENDEKSSSLDAEIIYIFDKSDIPVTSGRPGMSVNVQGHGQKGSELLQTNKNSDSSDISEDSDENTNTAEVTLNFDPLGTINDSKKTQKKDHMPNTEVLHMSNEKLKTVNMQESNDTTNGSSKQLLSLNLPSESPENDSRGVSPEIICLTHLSPTALYGKEQLGVPQLLSRQESLSRPPSLNTPDPVVYGESDSSSCPTPFVYTSSSIMLNYEPNIYTSNGKHFMETNYTHLMSEDPGADQSNFPRGQKRKTSETDINNNNGEAGNLHDMDKLSPDMFPFSNKSSAVMGHMYQCQGRPPDISTWTAVNSGACKYGAGFGGCGSQNYGNSFTKDPFLFGYQQQYTDYGFSSQINSQFSSKPTCAVPPYMLNHTQTRDSYSAYSQTIDYENQHFGSEFNYTAGGNTFSNTVYDPSEQSRASCQYASNPSIDINNNIHFNNTGIFTSRACCRLDFSSPVSQEQYQHSFPIPTFVSTHSYLSSLTKPEPVFPNSNPLATAHRRTATCTSTYSRPSSTMSTHSDNGAETPSIDLTQASSDEELTIEEDENSKNDNNATEVIRNEAEAGTEPLEVEMNSIETQTDGEINIIQVEKPEIQQDSGSPRVTKSKTENKIENMIAPIRARNTKLMCPVKDLAGKTVKELLQSAENKSESDGEHYASSSTQSAYSPPPAHQTQTVSESFAAEFVRQRKTKSPISAFCAALDLSKPKKKEILRPILPQPSVQPAIPIPSLLNVHGPTLTYKGSMMVPYLSTLYAANANLNASQIPADSYSAQNYIPIMPNRLPLPNTVPATQASISPALNITNPATLMNFAPYTTLPVQNLQYLHYIGAPAMQMNHQAVSGDNNPNINLSSIPLPLYQQLPQNMDEQRDQTPTANQSSTMYDKKVDEDKQKFLCQRSIGMAVPVTAESSLRTGRMETRGKKKKCSALSIAPPPATVPGYTATIQGCSITTEPSKDAVTYYPTPIRPNEPTLEARGKRPFKARHCNFSVLRIGTFQYTCPTISYEKIARVKFLYSKKKLVYEFQLNNLEDTTTPHRRLTEIEVPFNTIIGLWMFEREMRLAVNTPPTMCLGSKVLEKNTKHGVHAAPIYDRQVLVDLTDGQLGTVPYHYIQFKSCCAEKLKTEMGLFDNRFSLLLKSPLIEDPNKTLKLPEMAITSHLLEPVVQAGKPKKGRQKSYHGCKCETGCSNDLCVCCVRGGTCTEGECLCINCRNPLNILHQLGLPVHRARTDPCLMENIYQIKKLECYVKIPLLLECCQEHLMLLQCIPGTFTCPSIGCGVKYTYSWCCAQLCNEDVSPRNHCVKCCRCTDYRNKHCELCNICYFAGESGSFKCPVCHNSLEEEEYGLDSSSESDGYGQ